MRDLFGILVIVNANVINHVMLANIQTMKGVDKLVERGSAEECAENTDEPKIAEITLFEHGNGCLYS